LNDQIKAIKAKIAQLESEAEQPKREIAELTGTSDTPIDYPLQDSCELGDSGHRD
jgi:hypothetical protein